MNEHLSDLIASAQNRTVTVVAADGHPMARARLLHAAAIAAAGVILAPRLTAAVAVGALFKGLELSIDPTEEPIPGV